MRSKNVLTMLIAVMFVLSAACKREIPPKSPGKPAAKPREPIVEKMRTGGEVESKEAEERENAEKPVVEEQKTAPVAAPAKAPDVWAPFRFFAGSWQGQGEGKNGVSKGKLSFQFVLRDKFLQSKNETRFDPRPKNPKGEVHEDFGMFSYDLARACYVYRQFHVEGFVNQYICRKVLDDGKTFIFVSDRLENLPPEMKARLTYKILNPNEFQMTFDIAMPGSDYECSSTGVLKRVK